MNLKVDSQKAAVMKRVLFISLVVFIASGSHQVLRAQNPSAPDEKRANQPKKRGGIFTMYVQDPLARTMCFSDGKEGFAFVNNQYRNRCSDLSYILASNGSLASGIEVNRVAAIVDLGTPVRRGQPVARLTPTDFELRLRQADAALQQARARLGLPPTGDDDTVEIEKTALVRQAQAALEEARRQRDRISTFVQRGISARADLESAARRIAWGKWLNAGQTCVAPEYVLGPRALQTPLIGNIGSVLEDWYGEPGKSGPRASSPQTNPDYARIINDQHFERLSAYLREGRVVIGGGTDPVRRHIEPTVMTELAPDAAIMREEIFGPILPVIAVEDFDDAMNFAAAREKPLAAYLFTRSGASEKRFVSELPAGSMCINDTLMFLSAPELPFGGVGPSGMGQYRGEDGFNRLSHLKSVMKRRRWPELSVRFPPYTRRKFKFLKFLS